jgi:hypothetical protein
MSEDFRTVFSLPWITGGTTQVIPSTSITLLGSISGVVYAKPNFTRNPPTCKFYTNFGTPDTIQEIYDLAAGTPPGTLSRANHTGWPADETMTNLDINLPWLGFTAGNKVAIAFNIDDNVNDNPPYDYSFFCQSTIFSPSQAIQEATTPGGLTWIQGDTFQGGVVNTGPRPNEGKTVVIVCIVGGMAPQLVPFNLAIVAINTMITSEYTPTTIDPKIKNDG